MSGDEDVLVLIVAMVANKVQREGQPPPGFLLSHPVFTLYFLPLLVFPGLWVVLTVLGWFTALFK